MDRAGGITGRKLEPVNVALQCAFELAQQVLSSCKETSAVDGEFSADRRVYYGKCAIRSLASNILREIVAETKAAVHEVRLQNVSSRVGPYIDATNALPGRAPFLTIPVLEAPWGTTTVFLLRNGSHLPLHNHPDMMYVSVIFF